MPEAQNRRAISLIPGLQRVERFARRDLLIENLQLLERRPMQPGEPVAVLGEAGRRLLPLPLRGAASRGPELDVFEAYWADMVTPPAELGPFGRLWSGFELILYWLFSKGNLRAIGFSPTIAIGLMAGGVLLLLWYASLAVLVAAALRADPVQSQLVTDIPLLQAVLNQFLAATAWVEATAPYAAVTLLLATFETDELAQMAQFTKYYLENRRKAPSPVCATASAGAWRRRSIACSPSLTTTSSSSATAWVGDRHRPPCRLAASRGPGPPCSRHAGLARGRPRLPLALARR